MYVEVNALPDSLRNALSSVGYRKSNVEILIRPTVALSDMGGEGRRAYACLVKLDTGEHHITLGSWGGPCIFAASNPVDNDNRSHTLPHNGAVIKGSEGGNHPVTATIYIGSSNVLPCLPAPVELTERQRKIMGWFGMLTSAARKENIVRHRVTPDELQALVTMGLIKSVGRGLGITTAGENTRQGFGSNW